MVQLPNKSKSTVLRLGLIITVLGAAIRLYNLGGDSLWFDEMLTTVTARGGWDAALSLRDHPPLLYWLVKVSISLFGETEWTLRLPSFLAGVAAIPLLVWLGWAEKRPYTGLWAALFLAFSPFHLRYAHEARHYALLMAFSLASTLFLYLGMTRCNTRWWLLFALATSASLYTHYGAFMVLAAHLVVITGWMAASFFRRQPLPWRGLLLSGLLVVLLLVPWLPNLSTALESNLGETAVASTGISPLTQWLYNSYLAFGFNQPVLALLTLLLAGLGIAQWVRQRRWLLAGLMLAQLIVPPVLILNFDVARAAFPKYVIYMLPPYLLAAAAGLEWVQKWVVGKRPSRYHAVAVVTVVLFCAAAVPTLLAEYRYVERDWRGAVAYLADVAKDGDLFVVINLDLPDGFNQGGITAPFYLDQQFDRYTILDGNRLNPDDLRAIPPTANVWFLALDRYAPFPADSDVPTMRFAGSLFVVWPNAPADSPVAQVDGLLRSLMPITTAPSPRCLLQEGVTAVYAAKGAYEQAAVALEEAKTACPTPPKDPALWHELENSIQRALLDQYLASGETEKAWPIAQTLLAQDQKDTQALAALTVKNLLDAFVAGEAEVAQNDAPEAVGVRRFTMPQNGDWGDVLFVHSPAAVTYTLTLPDAPTTLHFRMAMAPESWAWGGDGSTFVVRVQPDAGVAVELFRQHIDNAPENQRWHEAAVSLAPYAGKSITLTLTTEFGPAGNSVGDWAGWETPRIMWQP
jgi:mannosyltransferase